MSFSAPQSQSRSDLAGIVPATAPYPELVDALRRPIAGADWGVWKTTILGTASFGLLPLLIWPSQFREFTTVEAHQLGALAKWVGRNEGAERAGARLARVAKAVEASAFFGLVPILLGLYVAVIFVLQFAHKPFDLNQLLDLTYRATRFPIDGHTVNNANGNTRTGLSLHAVWCIALSAGYAFHWAQVRVHGNTVRRFTRMFHRTLHDDASISLISTWRCAGIWPLGIIAAVAFARFGAWWGIPMLFAAAAQRRYMWQTSRALRGSLASRVGNIVATAAPTAAPMQTDNFAPICPARGCGSPLPLQANFCPRCGVRVTRDMKVG